MAITTSASIPLVSSTQFNVPPGAPIAAGSGAYGTTTASGNGDWILGSALKEGRALLVVCNTGAVASSPTKIKFGLLGGATTANGDSGDFITGAFSEIDTPPGDVVYTLEVPLSYVSDLTKYYSLGIAVNGASSSATVEAGAVAFVLNQTHL